MADKELLKAKMMKADPRFFDWLNNLECERITKGLEKEMIGKRELTRMLLNTPSLTKIEEELTTFKRKKNE